MGRARDRLEAAEQAVEGVGIWHVGSLAELPRIPLRTGWIVWAASRGLSGRTRCCPIHRNRNHQSGSAAKRGSIACDGSQYRSFVTESYARRHVTRVDSHPAASGDPVRGGSGRGAWATSIELVGPAPVRVTLGQNDPPLQRTSPARRRAGRNVARRACRYGGRLTMNEFLRRTRLRLLLLQMFAGRAPTVRRVRSVVRV